MNQSAENKARRDKDLRARMDNADSARLNAVASMFRRYGYEEADADARAHPLQLCRRHRRAQHKETTILDASWVLERSAALRALDVFDLPKVHVRLSQRVARWMPNRFNSRGTGRNYSIKTGFPDFSQQTYTAAHRLPLHRHHQIRERAQRRIHFSLRQVLAPHHLEQRVLAVEAGRQRPEDVQ